MKVTYTADDGTEFDSADECLAYEEVSKVPFENWRTLMIEGQFDRLDELWAFLIQIQLRQVDFDSIEDFWVHRRRFIELAKTFMEAEPTLKHLIYGG